MSLKQAQADLDLAGQQLAAIGVIIAAASFVIADALRREAKRQRAERAERRAAKPAEPPAPKRRRRGR